MSIFITAAQIRTVHLKSLPEGSTLAFVALLVFGGPLEHLRRSPSGTSATVRFLHAADCKTFYDETSNGLVYGIDNLGKEKVVWVTLGTDVDVVYGLLSTWISLEFTRCVRAVGVDEDLGRDYLWKLGEEKGRVVEGIEQGQTLRGVSHLRFSIPSVAASIAESLHHE